MFRCSPGMAVSTILPRLPVISVHPPAFVFKLQRANAANIAKKPDARLLKAKFHYASWFGAGSELVRSWFESDSVMEFGFEPARNQLV